MTRTRGRRRRACCLLDGLHDASMYACSRYRTHLHARRKTSSVTRRVVSECSPPITVAFALAVALEDFPIRRGPSSRPRPEASAPPHPPPPSPTRVEAPPPRLSRPLRSKSIRRRRRSPPPPRRHLLLLRLLLLLLIVLCLLLLLLLLRDVVQRERTIQGHVARGGNGTGEGAWIRNPGRGLSADVPALVSTSSSSASDPERDPEPRLFAPAPPGPPGDDSFELRVIAKHGRLRGGTERIPGRPRSTRRGERRAVHRELSAERGAGREGVNDSASASLAPSYNALGRPGGRAPRRRSGRASRVYCMFVPLGSARVRSGRSSAAKRRRSMTAAASRLAWLLWARRPSARTGAARP